MYTLSLECMMVSSFKLASDPRLPAAIIIQCNKWRQQKGEKRKKALLPSFFFFPSFILVLLYSEGRGKGLGPEASSKSLYVLTRIHSLVGGQ